MIKGTTKEILDAFEKKHSDVVLVPAFTLLLDNGAKNFTEEKLTEARKEIDKKEERTEGVSLFSPEYAKAILDCAYELSKLDANELWHYAHLYVPDPNRFNVQPIPVGDLHEMTGKPAFILHKSMDIFDGKWVIVNSAEGYPVRFKKPNIRFRFYDSILLAEDYGREWVAYDHEPPQEVISRWLYGDTEDVPED